MLKSVTALKEAMKPCSPYKFLRKKIVPITI